MSRPIDLKILFLYWKEKDKTSRTRPCWQNELGGNKGDQRKKLHSKISTRIHGTKNLGCFLVLFNNERKSRIDHNPWPNVANPKPLFEPSTILREGNEVSDIMFGEIGA